MRRYPTHEQPREVREDLQAAVDRAAERAANPPKRIRRGAALQTALRGCELTAREREYAIALLARWRANSDERLHGSVRGLSLEHRLRIARHLGPEITLQQIMAGERTTVDRHELRAAKDAVLDARDALEILHHGAAS